MIENPNIEINMDINAKPGKFQEQKSEVTDYDSSSPILKHENPRFACWKCGFIADSSRTLTRHASMVHRVEVTEKPPNKVGIKEEDVCAGILESRQDNQHITQYHDSPGPYAKYNPNGGENVQCDLCTYTTSRIRNMRKHMLADHTDTGSVRKDHNCDTCHHIFNSKERLKGHKKKKYTT